MHALMDETLQALTEQVEAFCQKVIAPRASEIVQSIAFPRDLWLRMGVVGLGRIGQTIARRGLGFDMEVRYHTRRPVAGVRWAHGPSLTELATWCDFLVVITSGVPSTRHLINEEVLNALGPRGFLINVARGTVVDEAALIRALQDGRIAGAGLDVFENEPQVPDALTGMDNVVLLPHIASATHETRQAMGQRVMDNLDAFERTGQLISAAY